MRIKIYLLHITNRNDYDDGNGKNTTTIGGTSLSKLADEFKNYMVINNQLYKEDFNTDYKEIIKLYKNIKRGVIEPGPEFYCCYIMKLGELYIELPDYNSH